LLIFSPLTFPSPSSPRPPPTGHRPGLLGPAARGSVRSRRRNRNRNRITAPPAPTVRPSSLDLDRTPPSDLVLLHRLASAAAAACSRSSFQRVSALPPHRSALFLPPSLPLAGPSTTVGRVLRAGDVDLVPPPCPALQGSGGVFSDSGSRSCYLGGVGFRYLSVALDLASGKGLQPYVRCRDCHLRGNSLGIWGYLVWTPSIFFRFWSCYRFPIPLRVCSHDGGGCGDSSSCGLQLRRDTAVLSLSISVLGNSRTYSERTQKTLVPSLYFLTRGY